MLQTRILNPRLIYVFYMACINFYNSVSLSMMKRQLLPNISILCLCPTFGYLCEQLFSIMKNFKSKTWMCFVDENSVCLKKNDRYKLSLLKK